MTGVVGHPGPLLATLGDVVYQDGDVRKYEIPTLRKLWKWCKSHRGDVVLYCHTKGVSHPSPKRTAWRHLMERWVVERWRENLSLMRDHDITGVNYMHRRGKWFRPIFGGNFWMARADWINRLSSPTEYQKPFPAHRKRFSAEMWPLSASGYRYVSLCCEGERIGRASVIFKMLRREP
jgi:hypothetical protein